MKAPLMIDIGAAASITFFFMMTVVGAVNGMMMYNWPAGPVIIAFCILWITSIVFFSAFIIIRSRRVVKLGMSDSEYERALKLATDTFFPPRDKKGRFTKRSQS